MTKYNELNYKFIKHSPYKSQKRGEKQKHDNVATIMANHTQRMVDSQTDTEQPFVNRWVPGFLPESNI